MAETSKTPNLNDPAYFDVALELVAMVSGSYFHKINAAESEPAKAVLQSEMQEWVDLRSELLYGKVSGERIDEISELAAKRLKEFRAESEEILA